MRAANSIALGLWSRCPLWMTALSRAVRAASGVLALIAGACLLPAPARAQGLLEHFGPRMPLRVVSLDLTQAPAVAEARPAATARPSWRTSFGSEIRTEVRRKAPSLDLDADIVLLQGLTSIREARRFFPARTWKLVVSRELIGRSDPALASLNQRREDKPVTAIAVRFQTGVRVTGQDHLPAGAGGSFGATAVRILVEDRMIWMVSVSFHEGCRGSQPACEAETLLNAWRGERREEGEATIAGGYLHAAKDSSGGCAQQWIEADPVRPGVPPTEAERARTDRIGCFSRIEIAR